MEEAAAVCLHCVFFTWKVAVKTMVLDKSVFETTVLPCSIDLRLSDFPGVLFLRQTHSLIAQAGLRHTKWLRMTLTF